jgi:hypothetical protein
MFGCVAAGSVNQSINQSVGVGLITQLRSVGLLLRSINITLIKWACKTVGGGGGYRGDSDSEKVGRSVEVGWHHQTVCCGRNKQKYGMIR